MKKKVLAILVTLSVLLIFGGCSGMIPTSTMPFNGDIQFHDITLTVPTRFIRDSTQSNEDFWVFERGGYAEYVLLSKKTASTTLNEYMLYMQENGANSEMVTFLDGDAVLSSYTKDGLYCQEILFIHNGAAYAIALRGGTEAGFKEITDTVAIPAQSV